MSEVVRNEIPMADLVVRTGSDGTTIIEGSRAGLRRLAGWLSRLATNPNTVRIEVVDDDFGTRMLLRVFGAEKEEIANE